MTLSKHEQDFADAMALKLRLNREARLTEARLREERGDFRCEKGLFSVSLSSLLCSNSVHTNT